MPPMIGPAPPLAEVKGGKFFLAFLAHAEEATHFTV